MKHSPVHAAVLALVIEQPTHTYDVWQRFDDRFGGLLHVGSSRIYQVMDELEDRGLVARMPPDEEEQRRRQPRIAYRATMLGARRHCDWLAADFRHDPLGDELRRRLLSVTVHDTSVILDLVNRYERACIDQQSEVRKTALPEPDSKAAVIAALRERLIAEERRLMSDARLRWAAYARRQTQVAAEQIERLRDER